LKWSSTVSAIAAAAGSIQSEWSRGQRAALWVAASGIGFAFGVMAHFLF
jgi:hypothetical protein